MTAYHGTASSFVLALTGMSVSYGLLLIEAPRAGLLVSGNKGIPGLSEAGLQPLCGVSASGLRHNSNCHAVSQTAAALCGHSLHDGTHGNYRTSASASTVVIGQQRYLQSIVQATSTSDTYYSIALSASYKRGWKCDTLIRCSNQSWPCIAS